MDKKRIVGTLKHGAFTWCNPKLFWLGISLLSVFIAGVFSLLTVLIVGTNELMSVFVAVMLDLGGVTIIVVVFVFTKKELNTQREISLWLDDAVELKAYSRKIGVWCEPTLWRYKIQIDFFFEGQHKYKVSYNDPKNRKWHGYDLAWRNYRNKVISILYSPKYDEVIVLKDRAVYRESD